jgi:hypothetical protein
MATNSYLIRQAVYQNSHLEGKIDPATEREQQPQQQDAELGSTKFGQKIADVNVKMPAGAGRDIADFGK